MREYRRSLLGHAKRLHALPVTDIRRADVASLIRKVAIQHGEMSAMRTRAALSRFWSWLIANDKVEFNVVSGTEGFSTPKRSRVLDDDELRALWAATDVPDDFHLIVRLCLWTGCRRSEAGGMRWSELKHGVWTVPAERSKNHRSLVLPLPRQARAELDAWPRVVGRDPLFGRSATGFQGWSVRKQRLDVRLGFSASWGLHDLRRTTQTRMAALGIREEIVSRLLNHAQGPIAEAYNQHRYLSEKAHALQLWADTLERLTGPEHANVFSLDERKQAS